MVNSLAMPIYVIAEAACEHEGSLEAAKQLILVAIKAGANCIKFQAWGKGYPEVVARTDETLANILIKVRLEYEQLLDLYYFAQHENNIDFLISCFDMDSLEAVGDFNLRKGLLKIPSIMASNEKFLRRAGLLFSSFILSTGMHSFEEIEKSVRILHDYTELKNIALLQCTSAYPCPFGQVNLRAMGELKSLTGIVGLSDHTIGYEIALAAIGMGATVIEKHITLDRMGTGPDASTSLGPTDLIDFIGKIRNVEKAMGDGVKKIEEGERRLLWRRN